MKIGIHHREGSFSDRWIEYLEVNNIPYIIYDSFDNEIISKLRNDNITHYMWHFNQNYFEDMLYAKSFLRAINEMGIDTFPNESSFWHFDDKVSQKYLLESLNAPLIDCSVFYDKKCALSFIESAVFPVVFKLTGGAGSINVKLMKSKFQARKFVNKAFDKGFPSFDKKTIFTDTVKRFKVKKTLHNFLRIFYWGWKVIFPTSRMKAFPNQKGYIYFQKFIPNLTYDIRLIVIGNKCYYLKRNTRYNDFRASGSGMLEFLPDKDFNRAAVKVAFEYSHKLDMPCIAYDFVFENTNPLIVEISYGFQPYVYDQCLGYFDIDAVWHNDKVNLEYAIIETFLQNSTIQ